MRTTETIDCTNYFNDIGCSRLAEALEDGKAVEIYIDCIGHAATNRETATYVNWLEEKYGERLGKEIEGHITTAYYLKN